MTLQVLAFDNGAKLGFLGTFSSSMYSVTLRCHQLNGHDYPVDNILHLKQLQNLLFSCHLQVDIANVEGRFGCILRKRMDGQ